MAKIISMRLEQTRFNAILVSIDFNSEVSVFLTQCHYDKKLRKSKELALSYYEDFYKHYHFNALVVRFSLLFINERSTEKEKMRL